MNTKHKLFCKIADAMDAAARAKISDLLHRNPSYICLAGKKMPLNHARKFVPSVIMKFEARYVLDGRGSSTAEADLYYSSASIPQACKFWLEYDHAWRHS
ncbi:Cytosolic enolase 3, partial [Cucurbita argyrosperma subsp. sororia]